MSLAQKVRDFRYSKGWGPDELANRAEISRTALYQIESGKTGLPRAGTLRRIAVALEVPRGSCRSGTPGRTAALAGNCRLGHVGGGASVNAEREQFPALDSRGLGRFAFQDGQRL
jgi:transcriptional regulator with XRE-family HTH domain